MSHRGRPKKPRAKGANPISKSIRAWIRTRLPGPEEENSGHGPIDEEALVASAPKRWTVYEPMVLLPSGSFASPEWRGLLDALGQEQAASLWRGILDELSQTSKTPLTHLAANGGIPSHMGGGPDHCYYDVDDAESARPKNMLRSPAGLRPLHGDFGPARAALDEAALDEAFWVSTKQNGVRQTWAPRWTMFSRGNVKEKARLLSFCDEPSSSSSAAAAAAVSAAPALGAGAGAGTATRPPRNREGWAVDLYAGIGYFAFSYARRGLRVLCWELNAWSVEGLRRGAAMNGWSVGVVRGETLRRQGADLLPLLAGPERIVVFLEDNGAAAARVTHLRSAGLELDVVHVNCGFLPTSQPSWASAWDVLGPGPGWLHLHENVGVGDIEHRRGQIQSLLGEWAPRGDDASRAAHVEHVELVKTFAPDVWHCVFDVYITPSIP